VHGAAIAGGCAVLGACDFVFVAPDAKLGYPVHRIGVSPAVTLPLLLPTLGAGAARSLVMSGDVIDGLTAVRLGLATHLAATNETVMQEAESHAHLLAKKGPHALRATKQWLNQLDGSLDDARFDRPAGDSSKQTAHHETRKLLADWKSAAKP
jgi:enoyl-CoA hydratase/carnithine racemase